MNAIQLKGLTTTNMSGMESFLGSRRSYLPRTGGASLRNTGRSFFANGGVSLPGANAFRGVDPRLLSAFMPSHTRWSEPRADAAKAGGAMYPEVQALLKRKETTAAPAVVPVAAVPAAAPAPAAAAPAAAPAPAPAPVAAAPVAAATKEATKEINDDDDDEKAGAKAGSGILVLPGTVSQPTSNATTTVAAAAVAPTTPTSAKSKAVAYADDDGPDTKISNAAGKALVDSPVVKKLKMSIAEQMTSMDRLRKKLTNVDVQIQSKAKRSLLYFLPGQEVKSFNSQKDVERHMGLTSHKQVPKFTAYGEVRSPSTAMLKKGFKGKLMAVMKVDVKKFGITSAYMPQRQSGRAATRKKQRINPQSSKKLMAVMKVDVKKINPKSSKNKTKK